MGTDERPAAGDLIKRLLLRPQGFNLFQAISLLERAAPKAARVGEGAGVPEAVRLSGVVSLGFQASDVADVRATKEKKTGEPDEAGKKADEAIDFSEPFVLSTPVLSVAGAAGPMPLPFTEMVLERRAARDHATADFLDIFNHRFLAFLYRSRKKHHVGLNWQSPQVSAMAASLDALSALGLKAGVRGPRNESAWLRHAGLLGGAPRSMMGLLAMLSDRLGTPARGAQFCGGWRELEPAERSMLGSKRRSAARSSEPGRSPVVVGRQAVLGRTAVLGQRVWDQSAGIEIEFGGLSLARLRGFLPGGEEHGLVKWMVRRYVQQDLNVELVLRTSETQARPQALRSTEPLLLGWTSWLVGRPGAAAVAAQAFAPVRLKLAGASAQRPEMS